MSKAQSVDLEQDLADRAWWMELGDLLGWKMYGWTYRSHATFITGKQGLTVLTSDTIELTGKQRTQILSAIETGLYYKRSRKRKGANV